MIEEIYLGWGLGDLISARHCEVRSNPRLTDTLCKVEIASYLAMTRVFFLWNDILEKTGEIPYFLSL
jgi:hypothetical protein